MKFAVHTDNEYLVIEDTDNNKVVCSVKIGDPWDMADGICSVGNYIVKDMPRAISAVSWESIEHDKSKCGDFCHCGCKKCRYH